MTTPPSSSDEPDQNRDSTPSETAAQLDLSSISLLIPPTKQGDPVARDQLLTQLQSFLRTSTRKHMDQSLKHKVGESDIIQQSLIQIINHFENFRGKTTAELKGWINTIVANEMNGIRRKFRAAKRDYTLESPIEDKTSTSPGNVPADAQLTPSTHALQQERRQLFYETLRKLSTDHAEIIRLRYIENIPTEEIAKRMNRSPNAVNKLWLRAMFEFEKEIRGEDFFQEE